jgi:hypothetical protein
LALLSNIAALNTIGYPVLIEGHPQEKRYSSRAFRAAGCSDLGMEPATATISALAAQAGVWRVRVRTTCGHERCPRRVGGTAMSDAAMSNAVMSDGGLRLTTSD